MCFTYLLSLFLKTVFVGFSSISLFFNVLIHLQNDSTEFFFGYFNFPDIENLLFLIFLFIAIKIDFHITSPFIILSLVILNLVCCFHKISRLDHVTVGNYPICASHRSDLQLIDPMSSEYITKQYRIRNLEHPQESRKPAMEENKEKMLLSILGEVIRKITEHSNPQMLYSQLAGTVQNPDFGRIPPPKRTIAQKQQVVPQRLNGEFNDTNRRIIVITNAKNCEKSIYGEQYRAKLDPRDQLLPHIFKFEIQMQGQANIMESNGWVNLCRQMQEYLVQVVENVASIGFNLMSEGKLKANEAKDYASKNLLLNVHSLFRTVLQSLQPQDSEIKRIEFELTQIIDDTLARTLCSLSPYYPQAPPTGGTPRMREALLAVDRSYNPELDFICTQKFILSKDEKGDYTEFIMKLINRVIGVTGEIEKDDPAQRTLFEKFVDFSENLFWLSQQDHYGNILSSLNPPKIEKQQGFLGWKRSSKDTELIDQQQKKKKITNFFIGSHLGQISSLNQTLLEDGERNTITDEFREKRLEEMRRKRDFEIGQKLPSSIRPFSKKDIEDKNFSCKHSSVLRILTKWAENLEDIFQNPQVYSLNRIYPFRTLSQELLYPSKQIKQKLFQQIRKQRANQEKIKQQLLKQNKVFQSCFLSQNLSTSNPTLRRFTSTRTLSSKINALLIQFMKEYVSKLIHLLVQAGKTEVRYMQGSAVKIKVQQINLVHLRIGDLMRSKIHCDQAAFIRLLKTLYLLDQAEQPLMELVRIKNKLDTKDNNILVNYLFKGQLQCELQVSVQKIQGKELNYYAFSHFLYELTRGQFGVLSECASIICQYDPVLNASTQMYYDPESHPPLKKEKQRRKQREQCQIREKESKEKGKQRKDKQTFICETCGKLKVLENVNLLRQKDGEQCCNDCKIETANSITHSSSGTMMRFEHIEQLLSNQTLSLWIRGYLLSNRIVKLSSYEELKDIKDATLLFSINLQQNNVQCSLISYEKTELKWFVTRLNSALFSPGSPPSFASLQYQNITPLIKKKKKMPQFTYIAALKNEDLIKDIIQKGGINKQVVTIQRLTEIEQASKKKLVSESLQSALRNKNQTLSFNSSQVKLQHLKILAGEEKKWVEDSLAQIQFVFAEELTLTTLPQWLQKCHRIKLLDLASNSINDASSIQQMSHLNELLISNNILNSINCSQLLQLQRLNISNNLLQNISLKNLHLLQEADLSFNKLAVCQIQELPSLKIINLSYNQLSRFECRGVNALQELNLGDNQLTQILFSHGELKKLTLSYNKLTKIRLNDMPKLQKLLLSGNRVSDLQLTNMPSLSLLKLFLIMQAARPQFDRISLSSLNSQLQIQCTKQMYQFLRERFQNLKMIHK